MKKIIRVILVTILLLTLSVGAVGCSVFTEGGYFVPGTNNNQGGIEGPGEEGPSGPVYTPEDRPSFENIVISSGSGELLSLVEAVEMVDRTSVAIIAQKSSGSGVILDITNGNDNNYVYILTCFHVISDATSFDVYIPDEDCNYDNEDFIFSGKIGNVIYNDVAVTLVGGDKDSDLALLKLDITKPAKSGNVLSLDKIVKAKGPSSTYESKKGETVFAIGNPTGALPGSVASGEISYLERKNQFINGVGNMDLMQISVTTNHGSSGGGLYNLYGELIGITNAGSDSYTAINYAIPYKLTNGNGYLAIATELLGTSTATNYGYIIGRREKFGFTSSVMSDSSGLTYIAISEVVTGSQAEQVGLKVGDVIVSVTLPDGTTETTVDNEQLTSALGKVQIGEYAIINCITEDWRGQKTEEYSVKLYSKQFRFCDTGN